MGTTGAPYNIPYLESSTLLRDIPAADEAQADAVAVALDAIAEPSEFEVLQTVVANDSTTRQTSSVSFVTASITASITPTSASSDIYVFWYFLAGTFLQSDPTSSADGFYRVRNTTSDTVIPGTTGRSGLSVSLSSTGYGSRSSTSLFGIDSPSSTSAQTYLGEFRVAATNRRGQVLNAEQRGAIILQEIRR